MSVNFVGYIVFAPKVLAIEEARKALQEAKVSIAALLATFVVDAAAEDAAKAEIVIGGVRLLGALHEHIPDAWDRTMDGLQELLTPEGRAHAEYVGDDDDFAKFVREVAEALDSVAAEWPPIESDLLWRDVPGPAAARIVLAAGDATEGEPPAGGGYKLLGRLLRFKSVSSALGLE